MLDYLDLGSTPYDEECVQVGTDLSPQQLRKVLSHNYSVLALAECQRYIVLLRDLFGPEPEGARLVIRSHPHDFGTYYEVAVKYHDDNELATAYAYALEADSPATWDDTRKRDWQGR